MCIRDRYHFAPTPLSQENLLKENISADNIQITGNTVIDALYTVCLLYTSAKTGIMRPMEGLRFITVCVHSIFKEPF